VTGNTKGSIQVSDGPLKGILVVSVEQAVAAPFCSVRLADAGARVLKIERPEGDFARGYDEVVHGESAYFVWLNRGKESVCLDLKAPPDRELLYAMVEKADVFIQNLAPGAAERMGFGSSQLRERFPRLITVDISGYRDSGAYANMKAYDLLVQAESGLASITGSFAEPGRVGVSICDIACGMYAHAAVLEALLEREKTSNGKGIKVSLFDSIADWMTVPLLHYEYGGAAPSRVGMNHPSIAPYGVYSAKSGETLLIGVQNDREWKMFCDDVLQLPELLNRPDFATNSLRVANRPLLDAVISETLSRYTKQQLVERLSSARIAFGSLNTVSDLSTHPQLRRMSVDTASGAVRLVCPPVVSSHEYAEVRGVPGLGEHTTHAFEEFGRPSEARLGDV
jgi:crotonobetainyl-CoA:carnitine CoA-transferase CaiB-like acyl-CoA transferase